LFVVAEGPGQRGDREPDGPAVVGGAAAGFVAVDVAAVAQKTPPQLSGTLNRPRP
jgi:hypothetical protein